ncbi:MAG: class I SAM-dependent methyltransferase [Aureispira sp.]|nr:class I SAM-dependent methyltransferase [Aureispira sp.]
MENLDHYYKTNQALWDQKTPVHMTSDFYDVPSFKAGNTSLMPTELAELGDVAGKKLLHLQCHFGMDTLSWARLGAEVTGVDLSPKAITVAKELGEELGIPARFIQANIFDLPNQLDEQFDVIFTSYGVLCWLHDLDAWGSLIERYLKPGGTFYIVEFHPASMMFEFDTGNLNVEYGYFKSDKPFEEVVEGTYAEMDSSIKHKEYFWNHSMSSVVNTLIKHGFSIDFLNEFPFSHYGCFPNMEKEDDKHWYMQGFKNLVPLMFSIKAKKL